MRKLILGFVLLAGVSFAGEKKLMHCFAFTAIDSASDADWQAFYKATDALTTKGMGVSRVWYGKLRSPMNQFATDAETRKKLESDPKATGEVTRRVRQHGVCMEMENEGTLKTYAAHPEHKKWEEAYFKVRQPGTLTIDILGQ